MDPNTPDPRKQQQNKQKQKQKRKHLEKKDTGWLAGGAADLPALSGTPASCFLKGGGRTVFPQPLLSSLFRPPPPSPAASAEAHLYDPKPTCENARRSRGALSHTRHTQARPPRSLGPPADGSRGAASRWDAGRGRRRRRGGGGNVRRARQRDREREKEEGRGAAGRGKTRRREGARVGPGSGAAGREKKRNAETPPARPGAPGPPRSAGGPGRTAGRGTPSDRRRAATRDPRPGIEKSLRGPLSRLSRTRGAGGGGRRGAGAPPAGAHLGGQAPARPGVPEAEADPRRRGRRREAGKKRGKRGGGREGRGEGRAGARSSLPSPESLSIGGGPLCSLLPRPRFYKDRDDAAEMPTATRGRGSGSPAA